MWALLAGVAALLAGMGVYDWRVRRRRGHGPAPDGSTIRDTRKLNESRANVAADGRLRQPPDGSGGSGFGSF